MFFEDYGHIVRPDEIKMVKFDMITKRRRNNPNLMGYIYGGPPVGVIEVDKKKYNVRGWNKLHMLMKMFDSDYDLNVHDLKDMVYSLLLDENIPFYELFNTVMNDSDKSYRYLLVVEEDVLLSVQKHPSPAPDNTFQTIIDLVGGLELDNEWSSIKTITPWRKDKQTRDVPTLILQYNTNTYTMNVLTQNLEDRYVVTSKLHSNDVRMRPHRLTFVRKKQGFEEVVIQEVSKRIKELYSWCSLRTRWRPAYGAKSFEGRMRDVERDDVEHELFLKYCILS